MKRFLPAVSLLLLSSTAYPQQSKNGAYDCVMEWSGGGKYNSTTKLWEGSCFDPKSMEPKFTLRVTYRGSDATKPTTTTPFQFDDYYYITLSLNLDQSLQQSVRKMDQIQFT